MIVKTNKVAPTCAAILVGIESGSNTTKYPILIARKMIKP
jgi:hypothetical protein